MSDKFSLSNKSGEIIIGGRSFSWGSRTFVMGVINATPDSFSGDGLESSVDAMLIKARSFQDLGADIIDIGGESTRPPGLYTGSKPVSLNEELSRVIPAIDALVQDLDIPISIDTYKAEVASRALASGASMINDIWALQRDPDMSSVVASAGVPVVLMHNQEGTKYIDVVTEVIESLFMLIEDAVGKGVERKNIIVDPGVGFGKTAEQNLEVIRRLHEFQKLNCPLLVGVSRKSTIGYVLDLPADQRVEGTAASVALSIAGGADIVRVHDVKEMIRVSKMSDAIVRGWRNS